MNKHAVGIRELADDLQVSPPRGRTHPDQPYSLTLHFDSVDSWLLAVDQYGALISDKNKNGDGHHTAVRKYGDIGRSPLDFAGAELRLVHLAESK